MHVSNKRQLILFVKCPQKGQCKTRLIPLLGADAANQLYRQLVLHILRRVQPMQDINIAVYAHPHIEHEFIQSLKQDFSISLHQQIGNNLGERMYNAMRDSLHNYRQCVLIGSDCPEIDTHYLEQAFTTIENCDIVFGPASDGGYVLIGGNRISSGLFENIQWSSPSVLQQSLYNAESLGYSTQLLKTLWDIDTPDDFIHHHKRIRQLLNADIDTGDSNGSPES